MSNVFGIVLINKLIETFIVLFYQKKSRGVYTEGSLI